MNKRTAQILGISVIALTAVGLGIYFVQRKKKDDELTVGAEGFAGVLKTAKRVHPEIFEWWDQLSNSHQMTIESSMNLEILKYLNQDLRNRNLSAQSKELLRRAGYNA